MVAWVSYQSTGEHDVVYSNRFQGIETLQYVLHVSVSAPSHMKEYLPDFELELPIDLTTDIWETENRELRSTGGIPVPALGLLKSLEDSETVTWV
jgi:hypothetical protein